MRHLRSQNAQQEPFQRMERPKEITDEARDIELRKARAQIRQKEAQLASAPDGTMTRDHAQAKPKISKSYEAIPIPKD